MAEVTYPSETKVRTCPDALGRAKWVSGDASATAAACVSGTAITAGYAWEVQYASGGGLSQCEFPAGVRNSVQELC